MSSSTQPLTILDTQLVQSTLVACGTLLVYDYICTLDQEIAYAWTASWSFGTVLFFLNRYLPFVDTFLSLHLKFSVNTPEVTFIPAIVVTRIEVASFVYVFSELPGCHLASASEIIIVAYIFLGLSETVMAVLTAIKAYRHFQNSRSGWITKLYREGLLFYLYLVSISLANVLVPILAPRIFGSWLATPQRVMHSVLCNRVLLHIFKQRQASVMVNRLPRMQNSSADTPSSYDVFESYYSDERLSTNIIIAQPSIGTVLSDGERPTSHDIP
uniref:DUF6533 domain-containing protein n=1 Tax=Psilocybe cubensis TaxID=181762 RepID=A0A8H8CFU3_PSICU